MNQPRIQPSLSHKIFFCFQGPNYYSQEKKDKSLRTDLPTMYLHWL